MVDFLLAAIPYGIVGQGGGEIVDGGGNGGLRGFLGAACIQFIGLLSDHTERGMQQNQDRQQQAETRSEHQPEQGPGLQIHHSVQ